MIIAIDGLAINGKTTLAKRIADSIGFKYFSAGALYRCIALTIINKGLDINNIEDTVKELEKMKIDFQGEKTYLDGIDVSKIEEAEKHLAQIDDMDLNDGNFIKPIGAIEIDTTNLSLDEVYQTMMNSINRVLDRKNKEESR